MLLLFWFVVCDRYSTPPRRLLSRCVAVFIPRPAPLEAYGGCCFVFCLVLNLFKLVCSGSLLNVNIKNNKTTDGATTQWDKKSTEAAQPPSDKHTTMGLRLSGTKNPLRLRNRHHNKHTTMGLRLGGTKDPPRLRNHHRKKKEEKKLMKII